MSSYNAQELANSYELDLYCVAANANPPVVKILDYGKFRYESLKKQKEAKKNQKVIEIKEIRFTPNIGQHDVDTKLKQARKFLEEGNKIIVSVRYRGRQLAHTEIGVETLKRFVESLSDVSIVEKEPKFEGRLLSTTLAAKKK
jgi:translation initiation factor IF-3